MSCVEKYIEKISTSTQKKSARSKFISARQHSKDTDINSYCVRVFCKLYMSHVQLCV